MSTVMNVLHIAGAVFIIGPMAVLPMTAMRSLRAGSASEVVDLTKSTQVFSLLSLVVAFFGFGALGMSDPEDHFTFTSPWVLISVILYAAAVLLSLFLVVPAMRRASAQIGGSSSSADAGAKGSDNGYAAVAASSGVVSLLLVIIVVLMVWKP